MRKSLGVLFASFFLIPAAAFAPQAAWQPPTGQLPGGSDPVGTWQKGRASDYGVDEAKFAAFDADLAAGKFSLVDSFKLIHCGRKFTKKGTPTTTGKSMAKKQRSAGR